MGTIIMKWDPRKCPKCGREGDFAFDRTVDDDFIEHHCACPHCKAMWDEVYSLVPHHIHLSAKEDWETK